MALRPIGRKKKSPTSGEAGLSCRGAPVQPLRHLDSTGPASPPQSISVAPISVARMKQPIRLQLDQKAAAEKISRISAALEIEHFPVRCVVFATSRRLLQPAVTRRHNPTTLSYTHIYATASKLSRHTRKTRGHKIRNNTSTQSRCACQQCLQIGCLRAK